MTVGEIALLVSAAVFLILSIFAIIALIKLGKTLDQARAAIESAHKDSRPVLRRADTALGLVNTNLSNAAGVTNAVKAVSTNVAGLVGVVVATLGGPVVRGATFTYGVRKALAARTAKAAVKAAKKGRR